MGQIMGWISGGLSWLMELAVDLTGGSWGLAIILVTILIRLALLPLSISQTKSMAAMKVLQPKLQELQEKYKSQPEEYQKRMMELYKEHGVNPLGGCLPMLIQLPFLWAFFSVLRNIGGGETAMFLGIWDLTKPDPYYIWPVLTAATTYFQSVQTATDPSQKSMTMIMPLVIGLTSLGLPSGLVLYWTVSNLFTIGQHAWISKQFPVEGQGGQK